MCPWQEPRKLVEVPPGISRLGWDTMCKTHARFVRLKKVHGGQCQLDSLRQSLENDVQHMAGWRG